VFSVKPVAGESIIEFNHDRFQVGACRLWLPEALITGRGSACVYPQGMSWRRDGQVWRQGAGVEQAFGPGNWAEVEPGVIETCGIRTLKERPLAWRSECLFGEDRLDFRLTVTNPHRETLAEVCAPVCFKFLEANWWSDEVAYMLTAEGVRSVAQLGRDAGLPNQFQAWLLEGETCENPFFVQFWGFGDARALVPVWVSRCEPAGCSVIVGCEAACFLHSNAGNPCTDLGIKYGDLEPGASVTREGYVELTPRSVHEILGEFAGAG